MGNVHSRKASSSTKPVAVVKPINGTPEHAYEMFYGENMQTFTVSETFENLYSMRPADQITKPAPPPDLYRISELIDPNDLLGQKIDPGQVNRQTDYFSSKNRYPGQNKKLPGIVETPNGGSLGAHEYLRRPDRPLAIRERQEAVMSALEKAQREAGKRKARQAALELERERMNSKSSLFSRASDKDSIFTHSRKGSDSSMSSLGSNSSFGTTSSRANSNLKDFQKLKIEEGRRDYIDRKLRNEELRQIAMDVETKAKESRLGRRLGSQKGVISRPLLNPL